MSNGTKKPTGQQSPVQWLKELTAIVTALGGLGATLGQLLLKEKDSQNQLLLGISAALAFFGLYWLARRWLARPSAIRKASALDIGRKYLRGRDTDLDNVLNRLKDFPLVWLVGESGAGKSSLLELGLVPRLEEDPSFFPVYLEHWGADWQRGPREGLCRALNEKLDDVTRKKLGLNGPVDVSQVTNVLGRMRKKLARTPVLVFDQFDDYQIRHRESFLRGDERKVVTASTLREENTFWNDVAELFGEGKALCLFVTRTDMQWGLECVRFGEPELYVLGRLGRAYASELLDEITRDDVVAAPERGWEGLKKRLVDDLGKDGWVLPIRMKFAFRGLRELRALSVGHYEREGGLAGLEALDVKGHLVQAARLASWKENEVLRLLLEMIEPESQGKTIPKTNAGLLAALPESRRDEDKLVLALRTLQDADILRQRIDPDHEGEAVWLLYHDYLCRGVLELDRRARRWQILLEETMRAFEGARGIVGKWRALLHPVLQVRFGHAWLRGRLRYGAASRFAAFSTVRLVFNVWILGLVVGLFGWRYFEAQRRAQELFYAFTLEQETVGDEAEALWKLSEERMDVRAAFYEIVFTKERNAERFLMKEDHMLQATLGLNEEYRSRFLVERIQAHCYKEPIFGFSSLCLTLLNMLPEGHGSADFGQIVVGRIVEVMAQTQYGRQLEDLASGLGAFGDQLDPQDADKAADRIVEVMAQTQDFGQLFALARGLRALGDQLDPQDADKAADRIVEVMAQFQDYGQFEDLASGLGALGDQLDPQNADKSFNRIVEVIPENQDYRKLSAMASGLGALGDQLDPQDADKAFNRIVEVMAQTLDFGQLFALTSGLGALGDQLDPQDADKAADRIVEVMAQTQDFGQLSFLASGLGALGDQLDPQDADKAFNRIVEVMAQTQDGRQLSILARGLGALGDQLDPQDADKAFNRIVEVTAKTQDGRQLSFLARGLGALGDQLDPQDADKAFNRIAEAMAQTQHGRQLEALASGLGVLGDQLDPQDADKAFNRIAEAMAQTQDGRQLSFLARGLGALGDQLDPQDADKAFNRIVEVMIQDGRQLSFLASGLGTLGDQLDPQDAGKSFNRIVEVMAQTQDGRQLSFLARGLGALGDQLDPQDADKAADRIVEVMAQTQDGRQLSFLGRGLRALGNQLDPQAADKAFNRIVEVMGQTQGPQDREQLSTLASGLGALGRALRDNTTSNAFRVLLSYFRPLSEPRCALARSLVRNSEEHLRPIVELLKWPTCSAEDRKQLIDQIAEVTGQSFVDEWAFIQWAQKQGFQPGRLPRDPEPLESVLKDLLQ